MQKRRRRMNGRHVEVAGLQSATCLLVGVASIIGLSGCDMSARKDWRPDSMRSADEWVKMALESPHPDERRRGVVGLSQSRDASADWALRIYDKVARSDTDPGVRCAALRAMEQIADPQSQATALVVLQSERDPADGVVTAPASVRWSAARVLHSIAKTSGGETDSKSGVATALENAIRSEPDLQSRITMIDTLGYYRIRSVPSVLVEVLGDEDFAIRRAAESSLVALTGVTHNYDVAAWKAWLAKTRDPFAAAGQTPPGWDEPTQKPTWDWVWLPGAG